MKIKKLFLILSRIFLSIWLIAIVVFLYTLFKLDSTKYYGPLMGGSLIVGLASFVIMVVSAFISQESKNVPKDKRKQLSKNIEDNHVKESRPIRLIVLIIFVLLLISGYLNYRYENLLANQKSENQKLIDNQKSINGYQLFSKINEYRQSEKLSTFSQDDEVCKVANDRLENHFWQTDLKITDYSQLCPTCNILFIAESQDNNNITSILENWKLNNQTIKTLKSNSKYGCVQTKNNKVVFITAMKNITTNKKVTSTTGTSDPIVNCTINANCGGGTRQMKQSECNQSICCQIGNNWSIYPSKTTCTQAQNNFYAINSGVTTNNYPPCTIYYPALGYSQTYSYISPEQCQIWKNNATKSTTNTYVPSVTIAPTPTLTPVPTTDPNLCSQAVAEWNSYKEDFYATRYNTYSSSAEAIIVLNSEMQEIQSLIYSYGCNNKLSL